MHGKGSLRPRMVVLGRFASVHLNLINQRGGLLLTSVVLRPIAILRSMVSGAVREEQRFECRDASTDNTDVCFDGCPDPDLVAVPCRIICFVDGIVNPVCTEAAGNNDDAAD